MAEERARLTVAEASEKLGIAPCTLRQWMKLGRLPIGKVIRIKKRSEFMIYPELVDKFIKGETSA